MISAHPTQILWSGARRLSKKIMSTVTEDGGRLNAYAKEPRMYIDPKLEEQMKTEVYETHNDKAEKLNGRAAMLGVIAALGAYALTGQIIPGIW